MAQSPLSNLSSEEREIIVAATALRKLLLQHLRTPRGLECVRTIDDVGKEITGDDRFFHAHGHKIP